jgi:nicotinamidase-related amidase
MSTRLHGLVPDHSRAALIILDMISDCAFPNGAAVARAARRMAPAIARLKARASKAGIACVYVCVTTILYFILKTPPLRILCNTAGSIARTSGDEAAHSHRRPEPSMRTLYRQRCASA